jgi:PAS domain S-box-containing protein
MKPPIITLRGFSDPLPDERFDMDPNWTIDANMLPDGVVWLDTSAKILRTNQTFCDWLQTTPRALEGKELFELLSPVERQQARWRWNHEVIEEQRSISFQARLHESPSAALYEWRLAHQGDRILLLIRDVRDAFEELMERKMALRRLYEETPIMLHSIDAKGKLVSVSDMWLEKLGYTREEVLGRSSTEFLTPESRVYAKEVGLPLFMKHGTCKDLPYQFVAKDGQTIDVLLSATSEKDRHGNITRSFAVLLDITEYRRTNKKLDRANALMSAFFEAVPDATVITNTDLEIVRTNRATHEHFGYDEEELTGQPLRLLDPEQHSLAEDPELLREQDRHATRLYRHKDGREFPGDTVIAPILAADGEHLGYLDIIRDVTEHTEMMETIEAQQNELTEYNQELLEKNEELTRFAFVASHDLQEPLRKIRVFTELLIDEFDDDMSSDQREYTNYILDGTSRMQALISDLLHYSRVQDEGHDFETFSTSEMIAFALEGLSQRPDELNLPEQDLLVHGHKGLCSQLLVNLLQNAVKYGPIESPSRVDIRIDVDDEHIRWEISDNGIGIDIKHQQKIFELFQRLHTARDYPGTGIGLAICKKIVDIHDGDIGVDSSPGEGSTFWFTLPQATRRDGGGA